MQRFILFSILISSVFNLYAQDSTQNNKLKSNKIILSGSCCYISNDTTYQLYQIVNKLKAYPATQIEYNKYRTNSNISGSLGLIFFTGTIAGLTTLITKNNASGKIFAATLASLFVGVHFNNQSKKHLNKSIEIYNKQF